MYVVRAGLGVLEDLAPDDPALQVTPEDIAGTMYGGHSGGSYPLNPYTGAKGGQQSFTDFVNQNAGKIAIGAGVFFGLMLFAKAGR